MSQTVFFNAETSHGIALRSTWALRLPSGVPTPWQRVVVEDLDGIGMVGFVPAISTRGAAADQRFMRWLSAGTFLEQYKGVAP